MEELGRPKSEGLGNTVRRKRSQTSRRPKLEASHIHDESPLTSTPPSEDVSKVSSDDNTGGDTNSRRKEFSLNQCVLRDSSSTCSVMELSRSNGGVISPVNLKSTSKRKSSEIFSGENEDAVGVDQRVKKVKLKLGGVTLTIETNLNSLGTSGHDSSLKGSQNSDAPRSRHKKDSNEDHSLLYKNTGLRGIPWKNFKVDDSSGGKEDYPMRKISKVTGSEPIRKSRRVSKKRALDAASEDDDDAEIKYLEKMKNVKVSVLSRDGNKSSRPERASEDTEFEEEEELSEGVPESKKMKNLNNDSLDSSMESKREPALTSRQRALLSGKNASGSNGIEFPNGLPPAPPRRQKEKLTEAEQQLKKAEAAQRRRLQVEKAARETEAEVIKKILGQDSGRKKKEDKNKKRQEELKQEKAAKALKLASNTIRWVVGPTGTVVTFPAEMGLPSIFNPSTRSYPPRREKCAEPSCNNPYKYRDSKTMLPLCSLQCYKAVQPTDDGSISSVQPTDNGSVSAVQPPDNSSISSTVP